MARRIPLEGLEISVKKQTTSILKKLGDLYEETLRDNVSLEDHSLGDLKRLGYPYSRSKGRSIHNPDYLVHKQSGTLEDAIVRQQLNQYAIRIGIDDAKAPHIIHIIYGTSKMRPRDVITESFNEIQDKFEEIIEDELNKVLK